LSEKIANFETKNALNSMKRYIYTLIAMTVLVFGVKAEQFTIAPGELRGILPEDPSSITTLVLSGSMDATDFETIADLMPALKSLDLRDVCIESLTSSRPLLGSGYSFRKDELPSCALFGKKLTTVVLPRTIKSIGYAALAGNNFEEIEIPAAVTAVGDFAFYGNTGLKRIALSAAVDSVGSYAFAGCLGLQVADLSGASVTRLSDKIFADCRMLEDVKLPAGLRQIGVAAFISNERLKSIVLPGSLAKIGDGAFAYSGLTDVKLPDNVVSIGDFSFACCPTLKNVEVKNPLANVGRGVLFYSPDLASVSLENFSVLPDFMLSGNTKLDFTGCLLSVTEIGDYALKDNPTESIMLASELTAVGSGAFDKMRNLKQINVIPLGENIPETAVDAFHGIQQPEISLIVADDTEEVWRAAPRWQDFNVQTPASVASPKTDVSNIRAGIVNGRLVVEASQPIVALSIYALDGTRRAMFAPGTHTFFYDMAGLTDQIYIVTVETAETASTFKLSK